MKHPTNQSPLLARHAPFFKCLAAFAILLLSASAHAIEPKDLNWKLDASVQNVDFYHAITVCNGQTAVLLRFVNKNTNAVKVSWKENVATQMRAEDHSIRGNQQLTLQPGETLAQDCTGTDCKACVLLPNQVNPTYLVQIRDFTFKEISVTK